MTMARKPSALTEKQEIYVDARMRGATKAVAKKEAGIASGQDVDNVEAVRVQLAAARRWLTDVTQITRLDVVEGIIDGIEMARMQGDAANVIKGWVEIAKILGHSQPEVKKIELSISQGRLRSKFEALSDEDLMSIMKGTVLDGECRSVN